jgi:hypothetical protein
LVEHFEPDPLESLLRVPYERGEIMTTGSSVLKVLLIIFAIIGVLAVLAFIGMAFMHGSMMGGGMMGRMMSASPEMAAACQNAMSARL